MNREYNNQKQFNLLIMINQNFKKLNNIMLQIVTKNKKIYQIKKMKTHI